MADKDRPPVDEVKPRGPLAQVASVSEGDLQLPPEEGPTTAPTKASSTAPPTKADAPAERMAVALAPQLPIPTAAVAAPPPPAVEISLPKPKVEDATPPKPAAPSSPVAPALVTSGDGRNAGANKTAPRPTRRRKATLNRMRSPRNSSRQSCTMVGSKCATAAR